MIGSKELKMDQLDAKDNEQLIGLIKEAKKERQELRFQMASGEGDGRGRIKATKRDVARMMTVMNERKLGIRTNPTVVTEAKAEKKATKKDEK
ncbi:MAG: 50S ribosomal protein L29 [Bifidobacteriaceae bacterium]|jgi:large subunit ribosomal protein L29|nr:50S ribosomal protein L29 [Bifidobacteriaceae bacterium]